MAQKTKAELVDYVARLEACVRAVPPVRSEAMLRSGDSPRADRAVRDYDEVRAKVTEI